MHASLARVLVVAMALVAVFAEGAGAKMLSVPNSTFDPLIDPSGIPPFSSLGAETTASTLDVDYWVIQRVGRNTPDWRSEAEAMGGETLAVFPTDALLVRFPESVTPTDVGAIDDLLWAGRYLPAYKVHAALAPALEGGNISTLLDSDGMLRLLVVLHRGEDLDAAELAASVIPGVTVVGRIDPQHVGSEGALRSLVLLVTPSDAQDAITGLAQLESTLVVDFWGELRTSQHSGRWDRERHRLRHLGE